MRIILGLYAIILCILKPLPLNDYVDNHNVFFGSKKGGPPISEGPPIKI